MRISYLPLVLLSVFSLYACGGGGGGDDDDDDDTGDGVTNNVTEADFRFSNAQTLVTNEEALEAASAPARPGSNGHALFTYQVANNGADSVAARNAGKGEGVSNLLAIRADGTTEFALQSNYPVKALYTAINPAGTHVYVAMDNGWYDFDGTDENDYSTFIALNNCALFIVDLSDDSFSCAGSGLYVQDYNDDYYQTMSDNSKPIQFDQEGNAYFLGTTFTVEGENNGYCEGDFGNFNDDPTLYDDDGSPEGCTDAAIDAGFFFVSNIYINDTGWRPQLYRYDASEGEATAISQDNENVQFFSVLSTGDVAVKGYIDEPVFKDTFELVSASGSRTSLSSSDWGVSFFTTDGNETVVFSEWSNQSGIRLARPLESGGIHKTTLDLSNFASNNNGSYTDPTPRRLILADDGNLYGVFQSSAGYQDADGAWVNQQWLTVYQVLPYDPVPKAKIDMEENEWWDYMQGTPFQISKGFLFYRNADQSLQFNGSNFGFADAITMVNLQSRETLTVLMPATQDDPRYRIYNWRLSGTDLYFSALEQAGNTVVTGYIDTLALRDAGLDGDQSDYLQITENASALGAASAIKDIEVLQPARPDTDPGGAPVVQEIFMNSENQNSVSLRFSKYMNTASVLAGVSLTDDDAALPVPYLPLWTFQTLHLIPDTSDGGLADEISGGFESDTMYTVDVASNVRDFYDFDISSALPLTESVTIRPGDGWYVGATDTSDTAFSDGQVAKFAGRANPNEWDYEYYKIADNVPANFRLEFSVRNLGYDLGGIVLHNSGLAAGDYLMDLSISGWDAWANYRNIGSGYQYEQFYDPNGNGIANGNWIRFRVEMFGDTYRLSYSEDGTNFTVLHDSTVSGVALRARASEELYFKTIEPILMDNVQLTTLDAVGDLAGAPYDLLNESFNSGASSIATGFPHDWSNETVDSVSN